MEVSSGETAMLTREERCMDEMTEMTSLRGL